uniref:Retinoid-inducible serine carboxypeptidase-like n=1 Tax=Acanthochromis polyacanthus TaxID=80966 RepID=A0A3Q1GKQ5_9TELE
MCYFLFSGQNTNGVNFYNILTQGSDEESLFFALPPALQAQRHIGRLHTRSLSELMNGPIRKKLRIIPQNVTWGGQAEEVFSNMAGDFMKPVVDVVDLLLNAGVNVTVYNGQLDLIVDTMGNYRTSEPLGQWFVTAEDQTRSVCYSANVTTGVGLSVCVVQKQTNRFG